MKKPDRFERAVRKNQRHDDWGIAIVNADDVSKLLRNEHAWMRRQLQAISKIKFEEGPLKTGIDTVIEEMVYRLDQRRK